MTEEITKVENFHITREAVAAEIASRLVNSAITLGRSGLSSPEDIANAYGIVYSGVLKAIGSNGAPALAEKPVPAVNPKKSIADEYLICLEDGKKFKSLKRHIMTHYGLSPDAYREKWGLPSDYPMVAPSYAAARSNLAKKMGLGKKRK